MKARKILLAGICLLPVTVLFSFLLWLIGGVIAERFGWPYAILFPLGSIVAGIGLYKGIDMLSDI